MSRKFRPFYIASVAVIGVGLLGSVVVPKAPAPATAAAYLSLNSSQDTDPSLLAFPEADDIWAAPQISSRSVLLDLTPSLLSLQQLTAQ